MNIYIDTSFLVSLYVPDAHSAEALERMAQPRPIKVTPFHRAEWTHAIARLTFQGDLSRALADKLYARFEQDRTSSVWIDAALPELAFERCVELARKHVARICGRTLDTLHVACALEFGAGCFWTFDQRQARLAEAEGLKVY